MRYNKVPASELENAIKWFSDTYLKESYEKPRVHAPSVCTAIRTAPNRIGIKWWWTDEDMLAKLEDFTEVFYYKDLGEW